MTRSHIVTAAEHFVKETLLSDASGHDWYHIVRVRHMALRLAEEEGANNFICELAALLHDIADENLNQSEDVGLKRVSLWLSEHQLEQHEHDHIMDIIRHMSFKGGTNRDKLLSLEGQVVQDADRLDAIGAIGIARTMVYAGHKGNVIHVPGQRIRTEMTLKAYRQQESTAIAHFYEKLLLLKDMMNTSTGRAMAEQRHAYMIDFLAEFYNEWDGNC